jgi:uncharacterized phage infection (PIP) family protein YhgE
MNSFPNIPSFLNIPLTVWGLFPITQQVVGITSVGIGVKGLVEKVINFITSKNDAFLNKPDSNLGRSIKFNVGKIVAGAATATPVIGTIYSFACLLFDQPGNNAEQAKIINCLKNQQENFKNRLSTIRMQLKDSKSRVNDLEHGFKDIENQSEDLRDRLNTIKIQSENLKTGASNLEETTAGYHRR